MGAYAFPGLPRTTFHGLPGLLADSLPDKFGNALIDAWLAIQGRTPERFGAVERLCYTGTRGMGALEFAPSLGPRPRKAAKIEVDALVRLASEVLTHRSNLRGHFHDRLRTPTNSSGKETIKSSVRSSTSRALISAEGPKQVPGGRRGSKVGNSLEGQ